MKMEGMEASWIGVGFTIPCSFMISVKAALTPSAVNAFIFPPVKQRQTFYLLYHKGLVTCLAWKMPSLTGGERLLPFMKQEKANSDRVRLPL